MKPRSYDPLDYASVAEVLAQKLMESEEFPLSELEGFNGDGVYALFYRGSFPAYEQLSRMNRSKPASLPIYIGSAIPKTNKGDAIDIATVSSIGQGNRLYERIRDHRSSISRAVNLDVGDFSCRALVLSAVWVQLAESALIASYVPVWNSVLTGFGNHDPGKYRKDGKLSRWDAVHPGRGRDAGAPSGWKPEDLENEAADAIRQRVKILGLMD